jgi:hypothetical protein
MRSLRDSAPPSPSGTTRLTRWPKNWTYDNRGRFVVEPGRIDVYTENTSSAEMVQTFTVR